MVYHKSFLLGSPSYPFFESQPIWTCSVWAVFYHQSFMLGSPSYPLFASQTIYNIFFEHLFPKFQRYEVNFLNPFCFLNCKLAKEFWLSICFVLTLCRLFSSWNCSLRIQVGKLLEISSLSGAWSSCLAPLERSHHKAVLFAPIVLLSVRCLHTTSAECNLRYFHREGNLLQ